MLRRELIACRFEDGETRIQVNDNVRDKSVFIVCPTISNDR
jgi:phosphoribosylpyrophosphate synthetase